MVLEDRNEMIQYLADSYAEFEGLDSEERYSALQKFNAMTDEEIENEVEFVDNLWDK